LRSRITPDKVMAHIRGICARVATMVIVRRFFDLSSRYYALTHWTFTRVAHRV
jgi:hypothetical protein